VLNALELVPGATSFGTDEGGSRSSVYISSRMFDNPTVAEG
jgi:hypothetical protein